MVNWVIWLITSLVQQNICCTTSCATDKIRRIMFDSSIENNYIVTSTGVTRVELLLVTSACAYIRLRTDGPHKRQRVITGSDSGLLPMRCQAVQYDNFEQERRIQFLERSSPRCHTVFYY